MTANPNRPGRSWFTLFRETLIPVGGLMLLFGGYIWLKGRDLPWGNQQLFGAILFGVGLVGLVVALLLPGEMKNVSPPPLAATHGLLNEGERLLKHGLANHYRGMVNVGGWLYLTDRRLLFQPASGNIHKQ